MLLCLEKWCRNLDNSVFWGWKIIEMPKEFWPSQWDSSWRSYLKPVLGDIWQDPLVMKRLIYIRKLIKTLFSLPENIFYFFSAKKTLSLLIFNDNESLALPCTFLYVKQWISIYSYKQTIFKCKIYLQFYRLSDSTTKRSKRVST